jgi:Protein kinase domain/Ankyrin repeats (3 copies)
VRHTLEWVRRHWAQSDGEDSKVCCNQTCKGESRCSVSDHFDLVHVYVALTPRRTKANLDQQHNQAQRYSQVNWTDILLEIRALLHEPLRYHPNIVRLLSFGWGSSSETGSIYPTLILEYAAFGSLFHLQANSPPLPFSVKQKLCYDVSRGLSILHACGIVHGDLKHENVLVFDNTYDTLKGQPYTAKLADFGGAVMNIWEGTSHSLRKGTFPYDAPEAGQPLDEVGGMKTDVYSFGMLVWRVFIDGTNILTELGIGTHPGVSAQKQIREWKLTDNLLVKANHSVAAYKLVNNIKAEAADTISYSLNVTIRAKPAARDFVAAQARLRGMDEGLVEAYLPAAISANQSVVENRRNQIPGERGFDADALGYRLGKMDDDYDAQINLPGYKTDLPQPEAEGFHFEPSKLKTILDWDQQEMMVGNFKEAAQAVHGGESTEPPPWKAAYYLFLCYLTEFGVKFDAEKACHWLQQTAKTDDEADVDYWSRAWLWRVFAALSVPLHLERDRILDYLGSGHFRGHRNCLEDSETIILQSPDTNEKRWWEIVMEKADKILRTVAGGVGMPYFVQRNLRQHSQLYVLGRPSDLDAHIKSELGEAYDASVRNRISIPGSPLSDKDDQEPKDDICSIDKIYVNNQGHGLLHYAASMGNLPALRHLVEVYQCDINLMNRSRYESPLVCACRSGHYACAIFLLDHGADANGSKLGEEAPLHWLCSMQPEQMTPLAKKLIDAGADLEKRTSGTGRKVSMLTGKTCLVLS